MKAVLFLPILLAVVMPNCVRADTFGSGPSTFDIEFVTIGNPGNAPDTTGSPNPAGSVSYSYRMGKFEISEQLIDKVNTLGGLAITRDNRGPNKPATSISWNEAARFVNWLNTSTGSLPAYKFDFQPNDSGYSVNTNIQLWSPGDAGYNPNDVYRNSQARYFLPSVDEWYKAAFYDPISGVYYDYPTGSNTKPTSVASGTSAGTAVFAGNLSPADITQAGGLSPYGTMAQGGNVGELEESEYQPVTDSPSSVRGFRGGDYFISNNLDALARHGIAPTAEFNNAIGFRVASILPLIATGDYNNDGSVDAADYVLWRNGGPLQNDPTEGVQPDDYPLWKANFGNTSTAGGVSVNYLSALMGAPEPSTLLLLVTAQLIQSAVLRRRSAFYDRA